jgi:hypothetical protein
MPASGYYEKYREFVNANSGLDPLSVEQVRTILKAHKEMTTRDKPDPLVALQSGETQCTARSKNTGERCRRYSMLGGNVCRSHGGAAPQTRARAQQRLQQAADVLVQRLLHFALDGKVADPVAMQAINSALDRAGLKAGIDLDVNLKPFQSIFEQMDMGGSRAAYRGEPEPEPIRELEPMPNDDAIEVEVIDADEDDWPVPEPSPPNEDGSAFDSEPNPSPFQAHVKPPDQMMTLDAAVSAAAAMRGHAVSHRAQRALPRGR